MKKLVLFIVVVLFFSACSRQKETNEIMYGFILYIAENKEKISLRMVNHEASFEIQRISRENGGNIFDENGKIIGGFIVPDNNKLLSIYRLNNDFEAIAWNYVITYGEGVPVGAHITKMRAVKSHLDENVVVIGIDLNSEGRDMLHEFTSNNIGETVAVVLEDKVISGIPVSMPLESGFRIVMHVVSEN